MSSELHIQSIRLQIKPLTQEARQNARALAQQVVVREAEELFEVRVNRTKMGTETQAD